MPLPAQTPVQQEARSASGPGLAFARPARGAAWSRSCWALARLDPSDNRSDSVSAAALSITIGSTGAFKNVETHELLNQEQLSQVLARSKDATQAYQPPGQQR